MQAAGQTGRFAGTFLEDFGKTPRGDRDNMQPRFGAVFDLRGNGRDLIRGGWGIYTDFAYTNANVLTASLEGSGIILQVDCTPTQPSSFCGPHGLPEDRWHRCSITAIRSIRSVCRLLDADHGRGGLAAAGAAVLVSDQPRLVARAESRPRRSRSTTFAWTAAT